MFIVAIYSNSDVVRPIKLVESSKKAEYFCDYYKARLNLNGDQWIGYDYAYQW